MKILSIHPVSSYIVETDDDEYPTYRRNGKDCWENLMGESWEGCYDTDELEALFQARMGDGD